MLIALIHEITEQSFFNLRTSQKKDFIDILYRDIHVEQLRNGWSNTEYAKVHRQ